MAEACAARPASESVAATIELRGVGKRFRLYDRPVDRLLTWAGMRRNGRTFDALRDVDLAVPRGRTVGIIGPNGAGKSTLLKLVTGTLAPTSGTIDVRGRVAALLELGTGFHPEFTGRQNIAINGRLLGLSREDLAAAEQEIIAFSELGDFIDQPIRTYSSGMVVRLGFSIAAAANPDVLIIDEALAVGDAHFSQKCIRRIRRFRDEGCTILFVSHDPGAVAALCDEVLLLDGGRVIDRGRPAEVLEHYGALVAARGDGNVEMSIRMSRPEDGAEGEPASTRAGTFHAVVAGVELLNDRGEQTEIFHPHGELTLRARLVFFGHVEKPTLGILIRDGLGQDIFGTNTALQGVALGAFEPGESAVVDVKIPLPLGDGDYSITAALHEDETHLETCYDWTDRAAGFRIRSTQKSSATGRVRLDTEWRVQRDAAAASLQDALRPVFGELPDPLLPARRDPSPFLSGFHGLEYTEDGKPFRWMNARGVFVFPARKDRRVVVAIMLPPHEDNSPVAVTLRDSATGAKARTELSDSHTVVELAHPADAEDGLRLFELSAARTFTESSGSPGRPPRELGLAVFAVASLSQEEPLPSWDAMTRSKSLETSTAS